MGFRLTHLLILDFLNLIALHLYYWILSLFSWICQPSNSRILAEKIKTTRAVYHQHTRQVFDWIASVCYLNNRCNWDTVIPNSQVTVSGITWTEEPQDKASIFRDQGCALTVTEGLGLSNTVSSIGGYKGEKKQIGTQKHKQRCPLLSVLWTLIQHVS